MLQATSLALITPEFACGVRLIVRGKASYHAACRVSTGPKKKKKKGHFGSTCNAVLQAELFMQEDEEHGYEEMPPTLA